jgi:hypothetical protein
MAAIEWMGDVDQGLTRSRTEHKPLLLDFSAYPT